MPSAGVSPEKSTLSQDQAGKLINPTDVASKLANFRTALGESPLDLSSPSSFHASVDQLVALGDALTDPVEMLEMVRQSQGLAHNISCLKNEESDFLSELRASVRTPYSYLEERANALCDRENVTNSAGLCGRLLWKLDKCSLDECVTYASALTAPEFSSFSTLHYLLREKLLSLAVGHGSPSSAQVESAGRYISFAVKLLHPEYLRFERKRGGELSEWVGFDSMILPFIQDENLRWVWSEPRLAEIVNPVVARAERDYEQDRLITAHGTSYPSSVVVWRHGDNDHRELEKKLRNGDLLPLRCVEKLVNELDPERLELVSQAVIRAAEEAAAVLFLPGSSCCLPYRSKGFQFPPVLLEGDGVPRALQLTRDISRIILNEPEEIPVTSALLRGGNMGALICWYLLADRYSRSPLLSETVSGLTKALDEMETIRPGIVCAVDLVHEDFSVADVIALFNAASSFDEAAALGRKLLEADMVAEDKWRLLRSLRTEGITFGELNKSLDKQGSSASAA